MKSRNMRRELKSYFVIEGAFLGAQKGKTLRARKVRDELFSTERSLFFSLWKEFISKITDYEVLICVRVGAYE